MHIEIKEIVITPLHRRRKLRIYLPKSYFESNQSYPVIYMHDGHNLFYKKDASYKKSWNVHETLERLSIENRGFECIVVGIDGNSKTLGESRVIEYSLFKSYKKNNHYTCKKRFKRAGLGGEGKAYLEYIIGELIPYIEDHYRVKKGYENRAMIGSSMGGLISLFAAILYPNHFSKIGAFSTAVWFNEDEIKSMAKSAEFRSDMKLYMDVGGKEEAANRKRGKGFNEYLKENCELAEILSRRIDASYFHFYIEKNGIHDENAWARRFPGALEFLFT